MYCGHLQALSDYNNCNLLRSQALYPAWEALPLLTKCKVRLGAGLLRGVALVFVTVLLLLIYCCCLCYCHCYSYCYCYCYCCHTKARSSQDRATPRTCYQKQTVEDARGQQRTQGKKHAHAPQFDSSEGRKQTGKKTGALSGQRTLVEPLGTAASLKDPSAQAANDTLLASDQHKRI